MFQKNALPAIIAEHRDCQYPECGRIAVEIVSFTVNGKKTEGAFCKHHAKEFDGAPLMRAPWQ
ncbi:MAG: hypothetical protein WCS88_04915 [Patescibacteria group bacterium]|jgi:hypothetical protein